MCRIERWRSMVGVAAILVAFTADLADGQALPRTKSPAWAAVDCATFKLKVTAESKIECGYVTVPRRHAQPTGSTIQLATVVLPASAAPSQPDPLFMAQGGPGGSTIDTYAT